MIYETGANIGTHFLFKNCQAVLAVGRYKLAIKNIVKILKI